MNEMHICSRVRSSCARWMEEKGSDYVKIHSKALDMVVQKVKEQQQVVWDEEDWHYQPPTEWPLCAQQERIALYILALDTINFCFWPVDNYQYDDLACTLTSMACEDHDSVQQSCVELNTFDNNYHMKDYLLSAPRMRDMTVDEMKRLFEKHDKNGLCPPDMEKRCALWNEVGRGLCDHYQGSAFELVKSANGSAVQLVQRLVDLFPGFGDIDKDQYYFLKRAQICVGDWEAALPQVEFEDKDQLTTFADYRLPQLLRHWKVLEYVNNDLKQAVDSCRELPSGGEAERSIRAATVVVVERLVQQLSKEDEQASKEKTWTDVQVDWYLWQVGERMENAGELKPHHRVRTIYY